jgi:uncharacterized protein
LKASPTTAENLEKGIAAYRQHKYDEALNLLLPIAESGNSEAQFRVGTIYDDGGYGVQQDDEKACIWFKKAIAQDHILALASHLLKDFVAERDHSYHVPPLEGIDSVKVTKQCVSNLTGLADNNDCEAILFLSMLLAFSSQIENDIQVAATYALKGAMLNDPDCMVMLGMLLSFIDDLEGNDLSIVEWNEKAYALGSRLACGNLGSVYLEGADVKRDTKKAFQFFEEAANEGSSSDALRAAECKAYGIGTSQSDDDAYKWFLFAAKNGEREAQYYLATIEDTLPSITLSEEEKMEWLAEAVRRGFPPAIRELGGRFLYGTGIKKNVEKGIGLLRQAASLYDAEAQYLLGRVYDFGELVPKNRELAVKCYKDAAENGSPAAHSNYGIALFNGSGIERDIEAAEYHFNEALEQGELQGAIGLGFCHAYRRDRVKALGYIDYAISTVADAEVEGADIRDDLIDAMTDAEIAEAGEFARQIGIRGTA